MKKRTLLLGVCLFLVLGLPYLFPWLQTSYRWKQIDFASKNIANFETMVLVSPKETAIGTEIEIEIFYSPQLAYKYELTQIMFIDVSGAYDYKDRVVLDTVINEKLAYPYTLGFLPFYSKFKYIIPSEVCPQEIVYDTCALVETKKGMGKISLSYKPQARWMLDSEGYQGDGEHLAVPIEVR